MSVMRRPGVAVACVGVLIVAGLCVAMSVSKQRPAGSNTHVKVSGRDVFLAPSQKRCTRAPVPRQAASVRLYARALRGSGPLGVTISRSGRQIAAGSAEVPVGAGPLDVRLDRTLPADYETSRICLRNRGERPLALGGNLTPLAGGANLFGETFKDDARTDYLRSGRESGWDIAPEAARRFGLQKAFVSGSALLWTVALFALLVCLAGAAILLRELPDRPAP